MGITRITRNFQITIPKDIRELIPLQEGDALVVSTEENRIVLRRREDILKETAGLWKGMKETGLQYQRRMRKNAKPRYS